jgi:phosphoribosyl 1,2-cyclic phosphodiesterase
MRIKFWGVRGSTPTPEHRNSRYGGNTSCIEIRLTDGTLLILDCGSGFRGLGKSLLGEFGDRPICGYVFLTHFHWDHIQGFPFFLPLYKKGNTFLFHSVLRKGSELQATIEGQMANPYFPVDMGAMGAVRHFYDLGVHAIQVNGGVLSSASLNHPQGCVGYRVEADGGVFVLATDTEPGSPPHDRSVRELAQGADVLVYDAQYTPEQLQHEKKGWGHSSWWEGVRIARECGVKRLVLFHHDPDSDDPYVDSLVERARQEFPNLTGAGEGLEIELPRGQIAYDRSPLVAPPRQERRYQLELPVRVAWRKEDGETEFVEGVARNLSSSGIYFVVPAYIRTDQPLELDLILPDELTHRGDTAFRFLAQPLRLEQANGELGASTRSQGVAARLSVPTEESVVAQPLPRGKGRKG